MTRPDLTAITPEPWYVLEVMESKFVAAAPTPDHPYYGSTRNIDVAGDENYPRKGADLALVALAPGMARALIAIVDKNPDDPDVESWKWLARWMKDVARKALGEDINRSNT